MQLLLLDKYASDFFFKLWSRVRKYGASPTGITQNVETLLLDQMVDGLSQIVNL